MWREVVTGVRRKPSDAMPILLGGEESERGEHDVADVPGRGLRQMGYQNGSLRNAAGDVPVADEKNGKE